MEKLGEEERAVKGAHAARPKTTKVWFSYGTFKDLISEFLTGPPRELTVAYTSGERGKIVGCPLSKCHRCRHLRRQVKSQRSIE